jgi:putative endonuclease
VPENAPPPFFVYIHLCSDTSYYVGYAADVPARVSLHNQGRGASWTARRRPVTLVYQEPSRAELEAMRRESQLKRWSHAKKQALVDNDPSRLKLLSQRHR